MTLFQRLSFTVQSWLNALLNRAADPAAELDYSYEQMRDQLQQVKRGIADLTTQKKRLEIYHFLGLVFVHAEGHVELQLTSAARVCIASELSVCGV
jgi:hypothetical protein